MSNFISDLFTPITRDERQEESRVKWIKNKCKGTIVAPTGLGKTRIGLNCISTVLTKYPSFSVIVIVPTQALQEQWAHQIDERGFSLNCRVLVVNTAVKQHYSCDFLILDECHRYSSATYANIFNVIDYHLILGLTATFERLDGKHTIMAKYCPVIDEIDSVVALNNGWISKYTEYEVIITVDDIDTYLGYDREFNEHFEFFQNDFSKAMSMIGPNGLRNRLNLRDELYKGSDPEIKKSILKTITMHAMQFSKCLQSRKSFINNHPKKIAIAQKIIAARKNSKIITFSNNIKMAESIGGPVYSGKDSKKKGRMTIEEFSLAKEGILNTIAKANEGLDVPGLSVAIILGLDSSKTKAVQRLNKKSKF